MILAEKITMLRKKNNWSQEELAERLGISRQSVSKWESGASIPDLDKIIKMSTLFGVSTDYLLKDELETVSYSEAEESPGVRRSISVEEANEYMDDTLCFAKRIAPAVSLCILSPICLLLFGGMAEYGIGTMTDNLASGLGIGILLAIIAAAVGMMILSSRRMDHYEWLEKECFVLEYGVKGIVEKRKKDFEKTFYTCIALGVMCCILGVVPLLVLGGILEDGFPLVVCICVLLALIALGVYLFIWSGTIHESYEKLLQLGDYAEEKKALNQEFERKLGFVPVVYWCVVVAIYLGISFTRNNWDHSWIVWPVAGVLFAALVGFLKGMLVRKK